VTARDGHGDINQASTTGPNIAHTGIGDINVRFGIRKPAHVIRWLASAAVLVAVASLCIGDIPPGGILAVAGDTTLVQQEDGQPAVIFPLPGGGIGYCTRPDNRWWLPWPVLTLDPQAPLIQQSTVFASGYSGFEILGSDSGTLTYAWRGNYLDHFRWHGPGAVLINGEPLQNVRGRPGFLQYPIYIPARVPQFLAIVPLRNGGLGFYERVRTWTI
jgi:hypothetical protein